MKAILVVFAIVSCASLADAGTTRDAPDPTKTHHEFVGADGVPAEPNVSEGRSVHEDSDRDEAHRERTDE